MSASVVDATPVLSDRVTAAGVKQPSQCLGDASSEGRFVAERSQTI